MRSFFLVLFLLEILTSCKKKDLLRWNLIDLPEVTGIQLKTNTLTKFEISANFNNIGHDENAKLGFVVSKLNSNPTLRNCDTIVYFSDNKIGIRSLEINWNTSGEIYCRGFISNKIDTSYTDALKLTWIGGIGNLPKVETMLPAEISFYNVKCGANLISNGGLQINRIGVLVSTNNQPTLSNSQFFIETSNANQILNLFNNLNQNTIYYTRGYAENLAGLAYSDSIFAFHTKRYYQIGEQGPAGGVIFYNKLDNIGNWNFMECFPNDVSLNLPWSLNDGGISGLYTDLGKGKSNTEIIVNNLGLAGGNYASKYCYQLSHNGYSDWFLPSRDELIKMYQNLFLAGYLAFDVNSKYWSSSEDGYFTQNAWYQKMESSQTNAATEIKTSTLKIRPIRCF
jgi:hypothetical protein